MDYFDVNFEMSTNIYYQAIKPYITGETKSCSYCDKIDELIIYRGKHFYITLAIGSYMAGYIQLCSYKHRTSVTGLYKDEYGEFEMLSEVIRRSFYRAYGNYGICFEHGQAGTCLWRENHVNSLCHHMHIHFLPVVIDIHDDIKKLYPNFIVVHNLEEMVKFRQDVLCAEPYLFFSIVPENGYMYNIAGCEVPRQFLRRCISEKLGILEKADWQEYPGIEYFNQTIKDLSKIIREEVIK